VGRLITIVLMLVAAGSLVRPAGAQDTCFSLPAAYLSDELRLAGVMMKPAGLGPFPAVIYNHSSKPGHERQPDDCGFQGGARRHPGAGALLENLVLVQLLAWREVELPRPQISYWRTAAGDEVDFVIESPKGLLPIEVKASPRARLQECRSIELFLDEHPKEARVGLLLYGGSEMVPLTPRILAAPFWMVL